MSDDAVIKRFWPNIQRAHALGKRFVTISGSGAFAPPLEDLEVLGVRIRFPALASEVRRHLAEGADLVVLDAETGAHRLTAITFGADPETADLKELFAGGEDAEPL